MSEAGTGSLFQTSFVRVRFTRKVPTVHLGWYHPFECEKRLGTLCGQTGMMRMDDSTERMCATCERMRGDRG